ncbi:aldo/keto reductase [Microbacterium wangchenii]|uniref:Aldo/keto reductase n=2 Tax=Microbacteriaceae TaxID=85023 RepID=A0ABX5SZ52_9MICO|nr:aldo/keto reductase [Microbacterium wangchenii]TXK14853.1 aldo/keto reductase [Microbacterium wangchenii]
MDYGTVIDQDRAFALLDRYVQRGGEWLDTANCYSFWIDEAGVGGASERVIGEWLRSRPGARDAVRIATKVRQNPLVAHRWPESAEGLSRSAIRAGIEASLSRLGVDDVDLLWAHAEDRSVALEETVHAFGELVAEGKARSVGAANHPSWRVERARALAVSADVEPWSAIQLRHSLVQPRPFAPIPEAGHRLLTPDDLDLARDSNLWVWAYTPLLHGGYVREDKPFSEPYDHPGTTRTLAALGAVAAEVQATKNQVVLAWLMAQGISPIVGASRVEYVDEAMDAMALELDASQMERLSSAR